MATAHAEQVMSYKQPTLLLRLYKQNGVNRKSQQLLRLCTTGAGQTHKTVKKDGLNGK